MMTPTLGSVDDHLPSVFAGATASSAVDYLRDVLYDSEGGSQFVAIVEAFSTSQPRGRCSSPLPSFPSREDPTLPSWSTSTAEVPSLAALWEDEDTRFSLSSFPSSYEEGYPCSPNAYQAPPHLHYMSPASATTSPATHNKQDVYAKDSSWPPPDSPRGFPCSPPLADVDLAACLSPSAAYTFSSPSMPMWKLSLSATPVAWGSPPESRAQQHEHSWPQSLEGIDSAVESPPMSQRCQEVASSSCRGRSIFRNDLTPQAGLNLEGYVPQQRADIQFTPGIGSVGRVADRSLAYPGQPQRASGFFEESLEPPVYGGEDAGCVASDGSNATLDDGRSEPELWQSPDYEGGLPSVSLSSPAVATPPFVPSFHDGDPVHGTLAPPGCSPTLSSVRCPSSSPRPAEVSAMTVDAPIFYAFSLLSRGSRC